MNIPETGRVVIIDDQSNEALPLLNVLSRNGISSTYFNGKSKELPVKPLVGTRLVFLDLQLVPQTKSKNVCAAIVSVLRRILSASNGPYLLFIWSNREDLYLDDVKGLFDTVLKEISPVFIMSLEKGAYLETDGTGEKVFVADALDKIEAALVTGLKSAGVFHLFVLWENIVHRSAGEVVNEVTSFFPKGDDWQKKISAAILKLAEANAGIQLDRTKQEIVFRNALAAFNGLFADTLLRGFVSHDFSKINPMVFENQLDENLKTRLNRKFHLADAVNGVRPGDVFLLNAKEGGQFVQSFQKGALALDAATIAASKFVKVEVSPICDWAQDKWRMHRFLKGILWPISQKSKINKKFDFLYRTLPEMEWNGFRFIMILDLRHLYAMPLGKAKGKRLFTVRQELLVDIQQNLGHHISRPGIQYL